MNILRSFTETVVTTPTDLFPISFEYDEKYDAVHVFLNDVAVEDLGYTVSQVNAVTLKVEPAIPEGTVRIERETDIDKMKYIFDAGALFIDQNVDADFKQIVHSQQEVRDGFIKLRGDVLPLVHGLQEALQQAQEASEAAQEAASAAEEAAQVARSADKVIDASGLTQQDINDLIKVKYFADLRVLHNVQDGQSVYVTQRTATYIHGGGFFKADKADTTSVDNDGTILVGTDGTRWKRQWNSHADPCWFGADYTAAIDCSPQVQKAIDISYGRVWFGNADRNFKMMTPVGLPTNSIVGDMLMEICGDGARVWVYSNTGIFTSKRSIGLETSTDDLYTAALEIGRGLRFQGDGTSQSVVINGDRLYNVNMKGGRYLRISALVRATQPRRNETTGYVQSVTIEGNHLALCNRIIDSKRGFNVTVSHNFGESCYGGVYLDGDGSPAVNVIRCDRNLWESSGVFAKLGAVYAGTFIGNYFEGNSAGDMPTMKCLIELGKVGTTGYSSGVTFIGNQFGAATAYKTDVNYADVKFNASLSGTSLDVLAAPTFVGNWTNAYRMWSGGQVVTQFGNSFSTTAARQRHQAPKLHTEARVSFDLSRKAFLSSTNLVGGVHTIAEVDTSLISNLVSQSARACTADMNIFMQMKTANNVVLGAAVAKVSLVVQGSEGIGTGAATDVYVAASLTGFTQLEGGVIDTVNNVSLSKHFTTPTLTIERVGTRYLLRLSGYIAASGSLYGSTSQIFSNTTMTIYSLNSGASLAGQIYPL
ncbi:tail fiber protein [Acinetobacter phage vB_AbaP_B5]|uniref:Tailspike protein n=1 Tax=Acinetobacter phage vB_AbaP_B5 TaxID=2678937 RepID=A0A221SBS6_9CAUD|nr:tail fiber protein [Acinetobacter phage vB_AbaP_B5]ASN73455.2 tailspike protein [Acinetobacter phage vB_AbaP_B5]